MKFGKMTALFCIGGASYVALELLWRGNSHYSMFLAGGTCFLLLGKLNRTEPRLPLSVRALFASLVITSVELLAGLLFNRNYTVWDYRGMPLNFYGQICLPYILLWIPLGVFAMFFYEQAERLLRKAFD